MCIVYTYYRVPEPAGRTFAELDVLFEREVSARKFSSTPVDVFATEEPERMAKEIVPEKKDDGSTE